MFKPDYVMGDLHLGNDCKLFQKVYSQDFETVEDYHKAIIQRWNKKVSNKNALVLVLGDIGKAQYIEEILPQLRGKKYLILGNHDKFAKSFYKRFFEEVYNHPIFTANRIVFSHEPIPTEPGVINFHGHTHHVYLKSDRHFNLCPEHHNYTPLLYKNLEQYLGKIDRPNRNFLNEWYANIQLTYLSDGERDDIVIKEDGTIDVEKSKPLVFRKRYKGKIRKGLLEAISDEEILEIYYKGER